ncbi:MAG: DUF4234 domain-containing protein [Eubacterium sp.]|nr:DUF4234 domain-containing protein [Eubacterium sp.]
MNRSIATCIILSIVTCGIYGLYWLVKLADETNELSGQEGTSGGMVLLLTIVTCNIYGLYWAYKQGEKISAMAEKRGAAPSNNGILYLLLCFFGLSIIAYALMQDEINKTVAA